MEHDPAHGMAAMAPKHRLVLGAILVIAIALRVVNYAALADGPCLLNHGVSDMAFFEEWSQRISDGDTDDAIHPLHTWHRVVAVDYLVDHPEEIGGADIRKLTEAQRDIHAAALWNEWYGGKTFHQEPLYAYTLALIRSVFGPELKWVHVVQMLLGLGTLLMIHALTRRYFGGSPALVATGLATLCGPLFFFELHLLRATPIAFTTLGLALLFERTADAPTPGRWFVFGLGTGVAVMLKSHFLAFGLLATLLLLWTKRRELAACARSFGLFLGAVLVGFAPVAIRNLLVGIPVLSATSVGPVTIANANHNSFLGFGWSEDPESLATLARIMPEHHNSVFGAWLAAIETHDSFGAYLALVWTKFTLALSWAEFPNNVNYYFTQLHSPTLAILPVTFTVVVVAALAGFVGAIQRRRIPRPLIVLALLSFAQLVVFYNLGRFRTALLVALLPLSGWGIVWLFQQLRAKNFKFAIPVVVACAGFAVFVQREVPENMELIDSSPYSNAMNNYYRPEWGKAVKNKDWSRALELMELAIDTRPDYLDALSPQFPPNTRSELTTTGFYADFYNNYARVLLEFDRTTEAQTARKRAEELAATYEHVQNLLRKGK